MQLENEKLAAFISEEVQKAGIATNVLGYKYITCAVYFILHDATLMHKIIILYHKIADHYSATYAGVEHSIRHAISSAYNFRPDAMKTVMDDTYQPRNSEFICTITEKIRIQMIKEDLNLL